MAQFDWENFLRTYNAELLRSEQLAEALRFADGDDLQGAVNAGWLGYPPAGDAEIAAVEERLQMSLPPSYRTFLRTSNGWRFPGTHIPRLWPAQELAWFRDTDAETIEIWSEGDPGLGRQLENALRISDQELAGSAVYLLVPGNATGSGECEAWMFAHWIPGEERYISFRELMEEARTRFLDMEGEEAKRMLPGEPLSDLSFKVGNLRDELRAKAETYRQYSRNDPAGSLTAGQTARGLDEVADRVEMVMREARDPADLLSSLRRLQHEVEAEHRAIHERWVQRRSVMDMLRLVQGGRAMSRGEGLRQAGGIIEYFLKDTEG